MWCSRLVKERHPVFSSRCWSAFLSKKIVIHSIHSVNVELEIPYKFVTTYPRSPIQTSARSCCGVVVCAGILRIIESRGARWV